MGDQKGLLALTGPDAAPRLPLKGAVPSGPCSWGAPNLQKRGATPGFTFQMPFNKAGSAGWRSIKGSIKAPAFSTKEVGVWRTVPNNPTG